MAKVLVGLVQRLLRRDDTQLKLLLLCTVIATVGFAFPRLVWATYIGYSLIALLLTQVMVGSTNCLLYTSPSPRDATLSRMPSSA